MVASRRREILFNLLIFIQKDAITWVIEAPTTTDQRAVERIVQQVISVFFASAHQLPVVRHPLVKGPKDNVNSRLRKLLMFSTYRLCEHPGYTKTLLNEIEAMLKLPTKDHYKHLPLMESFLREAARHDPLDSCMWLQICHDTIQKRS